MGRLHAAALILLAACSIEAVADRLASHSDARFQEMADRAALAGVNALAATEGQPEPDRIDAARNAANAVVSSAGSVATETDISTGRMSMRIALVSKRGTSMHATARYVAPGEALTDRRDARMAAKRS